MAGECPSMGEDRVVLVTGARGMLGSDLCPVLAEAGWRVVAADLDEFDITDPAAARDFVSGCRPAVIVNCAAYTAVDKAETEYHTAFRVNHRGARNVAEAAAAVGAALVQISTDYVFDGTKEGAYTEEDPTNPVNAYGLSKLLGELAVRVTLEKHYIVRTSWLHGLHGKSFPRTMLTLAQPCPGGKPRSLRVVSDQVGAPTYTVHLAKALAVIISKPCYGTYHAVNAGCCSWYEFACEVFRAAGLDPEVTPIPSSEYPTPAPRPKNSLLDTSKLARVYGHQLPSWQKGACEFVRLWRASR